MGGRVDRGVRRAVLERLAAVEELALQAGSHLPAQVARTHLKTITDSWRELLLKHQPDHKGRCPMCSGWLRRRRWPCQVWVTAHQHLIGDAPGLTGKPDKKITQFRPPRQVEVIPRQVGAPTAADQIITGQASSRGARGQLRPAPTRPAADRPVPTPVPPHGDLPTRDATRPPKHERPKHPPPA